MATDLRLDDVDGTYVVVQGRVLKVVGSDFILDSPDRRKNDTPNRRAMVHDGNDGLTLNFNGDYPGGVTVTGELTFGGAALSKTLADLQYAVQSLKLTFSQSSERIDRLETIVDSLVDLAGASVVPPWKTQHDVENGDSETALGGGPEVLSAAALGLTVTYQYDRQIPGFAHEAVISTAPPAGTAVKRGSTVVVTLNLLG
jgi:hypothetical protein